MFQFFCGNHPFSWIGRQDIYFIPPTLITFLKRESKFGTTPVFRNWPKFCCHEHMWSNELFLYGEVNCVKCTRNLWTISRTTFQNESKMSSDELSLKLFEDDAIAAGLRSQWSCINWPAFRVSVHLLLWKVFLGCCARRINRMSVTEIWDLIYFIQSSSKMMVSNAMRWYGMCGVKIKKNN